MPYEYDIFLSYKRGGDVEDWVVNHFHDRLLRCLEGVMDRDPKIFIDKTIATGSSWPDVLKNALRSSRILVSIWSPPYFRSEWCDAEWKSMLERERINQLTSQNRPDGLIYPIRFSDGDTFPEQTSNIQCFCMKAWNYPARVFAETPGYIEFCDQVKTVAEEVKSMLAKVPDWEEWPIVEPSPAAPVNAGVPTL